MADVLVEMAGPVGLALAIPILAAALLLMLSRFFESKELDQAAKSELVFAGSTVFLVGALLALIFLGQGVLLTVANEIVGSATGQTPQFTNLIDATLAYMGPRLDCMDAIIQRMYEFSIFFEMSSTTYIEVFMSEVSSGFAYKMVTERIVNTTNSLAFFTYVYYLIVHILVFLKHTALTLFLPAGIVLRAFPPTRGAGAYIIGFSLGLYFIFPFSYIVMSAISLDYGAGSADKSADMCTVAGIEKAWPSVEKAPSSCGFRDQLKVKEMESGAKRNQSKAEGFLDYLQLTVLKKISMNVSLVPLMAMVITLSFVLSTTSLFGGNIPEVGRGLVKLI